MTGDMGAWEESRREQAHLVARLVCDGLRVHLSFPFSFQGCMVLVAFVFKMFTSLYSCLFLVLRHARRYPYSVGQYV